MFVLTTLFSDSMAFVVQTFFLYLWVVYERIEIFVIATPAFGDLRVSVVPVLLELIICLQSCIFRCCGSTAYSTPVFHNYISGCCAQYGKCINGYASTNRRFYRIQESYRLSRRQRLQLILLCIYSEVSLNISPLETFFIFFLRK